MISKTELREIAAGFATIIREHEQQVIAPMQRKLDHLQREISLLKIQQRGHAIRAQVQAHEAEDD